MPRDLEELAEMIAKRDGISYNEAVNAISECAHELEYAFMNGSLEAAENTLAWCLGLEPDYLDLFIY